MENCEARLEKIESQRSIPSVSYDQQRRIYFNPMNLIKRIILHKFCSKETTLRTIEPEPTSDFLYNLKISDLFHSLSEYVQMNPEIFTAVSAGNKEHMEKLISYGTPMACFKSDQGDSVLHLAAVYGRLELVKSIISECPCLLLELDSRDQLPLHVAARAGHSHIVKAIVATLTFVSSNLADREERERLNLYVVKDKNGDTPLHLALKGHHMKIGTCLVSGNQRASFMANKDGVSPLYLAVEAGDVSLVKEMLKTRKDDSYLEGRKDLAHAALRAKSTEMLDVILSEYPNIEDERDENGRTCLSLAASMGHYQGVRHLLKRSTKGVYICDDDGSFPIHVAVEKSHTSVVLLLIRRCPDSKYLLNKKGQNIIHVATKRGKVVIQLSRVVWRTGWINQLIEKQDVDGNTPLHLATINWRPRTLYLFLVNSKRISVLVHIRNNDGLTALNIAESNLQPNYMFMERLTLMVLLCYYHASVSGVSWFNTVTKSSKPLKNKDYVNSLLVVAALVATVTFAAGFTIPGGFNGSSPNVGMPALASDPKLSYFMVFDILALQCSVVTIALLIWAQLGDPVLVHISYFLALPSLFLSLLCMLVAFYCGVYVAFVHVKGLIIFLNVASVVFVCLMLFLLGPHIFLQIPGIPAFLGHSFLIFSMFVDEDNHRHISPAKILEVSATNISLEM